MFHQIMVPLDGSELAERALAPALELAQISKATLHLVRVSEPSASWLGLAVGLPPTIPATPYPEMLQAESEAITTYLEQQRHSIAERGVHVRVSHLEGYTAASLLDYERDAGIDLVVMCSHGRSGLARFAVGSVADRMVHHGNAPVLLVRAFGEPLSMQHAIVPLDGSERAEETLSIVDHLAQHVVREVTLLRAIHNAEEGPEAERYLTEASSRLQQEHIACWRRVVVGDPAQAIIEAAGADKLVIMTSRGHSGLARWALGSVADRVLHGWVAGVLVVRSGTVLPTA